MPPEEKRPGKTPLRVEDVRNGELYGVLIQAAGEAKQIPDWFIANKLRAAEDWYEHTLNVFFGHRRIFSNPQARGIPTTDYDIGVPALDYTRGLFNESRWGWIDLDYRPIVSIERLFFSYPGTGRAASYEVPVDWLQVKHKFGKVQIVPTHGAAVIAHFNAWVLSVLAGGRGLAQSIYVDYTAGLSNEELKRHHQDLLEGVLIRASLLCLPVLTNVISQGLGTRSLSMDGLSRSESFGSGKWGAYSGMIEQLQAREKEILDSWRDSERGPTLMVLGT
jgi:hypothetical protein